MKEKCSKKPIVVCCLLLFACFALSVCGKSDDNGVIQRISVTTPPVKSVYNAGEKFSINGMVVTAYYSDNTKKTVTDYTFEPSGPLGLSDKSVTISYEDKQATVSIQVLLEIPPLGGYSNDYFSNDFDPSLCSFYDKFSGTGTDLNENGLDRAKWGYQNYGNGFGNNEQQYYRGDTNAIVQDGILSLLLEKRPNGEGNQARQYTSAKLWTSTSTSNGGNPPTGEPFSQKYGRFEAKIRLISHTTDVDEGFWPAFWMMPRESVYGGWPRSGEIDIMEMKGRIKDQASSTLHMSPPSGSGGSRYRGSDHGFDEGDITDWHVYSIIWSPTGMKMLIDGKMFREILFSTLGFGSGFYSTFNPPSPTEGPFNQDFYLILNFAVGGNFDGGRLPKDEALPASLDIDWVRVYTLENDPWGEPESFTGHISNFQSNN